ncbi:prospero homeobox protein 2 [Tamandua tetradactyla]|uniref:prospero homeobox protein 2 n=1 Tax=Tamandua tetradactyla TaxID=48850 RepID=UPI0040548BD0
MDPNSILPSPQSRTCSHPTEPRMEGGRNPSGQELGRDPLFPWSQVSNSSLADPDWFGDKLIQAKRARVETIVQGMCLSPSPLGSGNILGRDSPCCLEKARDRRRKQSLPLQQGLLKPGPAGDPGNRKGPGGPQVTEQLQLLKQQLRHLQEHILQAAGPMDTAQGPEDPEKWKGPLKVKQRNGSGFSPWALDRDHQQGSSRDLSRVEKHRGSEVEYHSEEPRRLPHGTQALLEILKKELTKAVSQAVNSVLQKILVDPPGHLTQLSRSFQELVSEVRRDPSPSGGGACKGPLPLAALPRRVQPQAGVPLGNLSLPKPLDPPKYSVSSRIIPKSYQALPTNYSLTVPSQMQETQILSQLLSHGHGGHWNTSPPQDSSSQSHPSSETTQRPWRAVELHPSILRQQQDPLPLACLENLPLLPSVKMEQGGLQAVTDALPFSSVHIQEGLNPGHLKKAKLMFFFTRYPSSNLLKGYFPDVQFNRSITSQMIKWFSNFREFYYIQMEKFARQAISEGVMNPKRLVVLRDSELFRALNMHYNKGNDFEVPDCFLEIASLTLQEFFRAVSAGKDSDPSWKKPIYKIISKLDSDIPEIFKSSSYPQELFRS